MAMSSSLTSEPGTAQPKAGTLTRPNLAFAGPDRKTLCIVGRGNAFKVQILAQGFTSRAK